MLAAGVALFIFSIVCLASAGAGTGMLQDTYYCLDLDLQYGRFSVGGAIDALEEIGMDDFAVSGFQQFAIYARFPLLIIALALTGISAFTLVKFGAVDTDAFFRLWQRVCAASAGAWRKLTGAFGRCMAARRCAECGAFIGINAAFCRKCGVKHEHAGQIACAECGGLNRNGANFCRHCGNSMNKG